MFFFLFLFFGGGGGGGVGGGGAGLPKASPACQVGLPGRPARPDPGLTGRQASYYYKLLIHFAMSL